MSNKISRQVMQKIFTIDNKKTQILRQLAYNNRLITEEHHTHFHSDYMGKASGHSSQMLQNFLKR